MASRYAAWTHIAAAKLRCRDGLMAGSATETMEPSSGVMKAPTEVSASSCQRRRYASSGVMRCSRPIGAQDTQVTISSRGARERSKVLAAESSSGCPRVTATTKRVSPASGSSSRSSRG